MNGKGKKKTKGVGKPAKAFLRGLILFLFFLALNILFENRDEIGPEGTSCDTAHADPTPPFYEWLYPWLTRHLLGDGTSDQVRILFIPQDLLAVQQNLCKGRSYLADVITALTESERYRPSTIVLDKYFSSSACMGPGDTEATSSLQNAVTAAQKAGIKVIVGESTTPAPFRTEDHSCLQQDAKQLRFESPGMPPAPSGLLKLNANREQIPLKWKVLAEAPDSRDAKGTPRESLAVVTAKTVAPDLESNPHFKAVMSEARQPYARLGLNIPGASTQNLLCGLADTTRQKVWDCPSPASLPVLDDAKKPFASKGKVVIVGSQNEVDHRTVLGQRRWGYDLQAEYIEALLSGKYLRAASGAWIFSLSILFVLLLEGVPALGDYLYCEKKLPVPKPLRDEETWVWFYPLAFCSLVLAIFLPLHYLPPLSVLFGALVTMVARLLFNGMEHYRKLTVPHKKELEP